MNLGRHRLANKGAGPKSASTARSTSTGGWRSGATRVRPACWPPRIGSSTPCPTAAPSSCPASSFCAPPPCAARSVMRGRRRTRCELRNCPHRGPRYPDRRTLGHGADETIRHAERGRRPAGPARRHRRPAIAAGQSGWRELHRACAAAALGLPALAAAAMEQVLNGFSDPELRERVRNPVPWHRNVIEALALAGDAGGRGFHGAPHRAFSDASFWRWKARQGATQRSRLGQQAPLNCRG